MLTYSVPVMLPILIAETVTNALETKGIYDLVIELSNLPICIWGSFRISDAVSGAVQRSPSRSVNSRSVDGP